MAELIALAMPAGRAFVAELQRAWDAGDAVLPVDIRLPAPARQRLLHAMAPTVVVDEAGRHPWGGGQGVEPGDALVVPTSGSTGDPKGVVLTHDAVAASAWAGSELLGADPETDRWLACMPLHHMAGLGVVTRALLTGTPLVIHEGFDAAAVDEAAADGCTLTTMVPTALQRVRAHRWRRIVVGGADVPPDIPPVCVTSYGLTETCGGLVYDGHPFPGCEVMVDQASATESGRHSGQIFVRGPLLLRAYRDGSVPVDGDGWLATGDAGHLTPDGRLEVDGRLSDLIITGGENVWPGPVEDVIRSHPAVTDVAVVGRPDPEWGQRVVAVVEPRGDGLPTLEELRALVKDQLPAFCAPKALELVSSLPRTGSGKVRRSAV